MFLGSIFPTYQAQTKRAKKFMHPASLFMTPSSHEIRQVTKKIRDHSLAKSCTTFHLFLLILVVIMAAFTALEFSHKSFLVGHDTHTLHVEPPIATERRFLSKEFRFCVKCGFKKNVWFSDRNHTYSSQATYCCLEKWKEWQWWQCQSTSARALLLSNFRLSLAVKVLLRRSSSVLELRILPLKDFTSQFLHL